jgi:predicted phage tail protein
MFINNLNREIELKLCKVTFSGFDFECETELEIGAYSVADLLVFLKQMMPEFEQEVLVKMGQNYKFVVEVNKEFLIADTGSLNILLPYQINDVCIHALPQGQGSVGKIALGVGLLGLGLSGVGLLGISATGVSLFGASLVFSSLFKHPKTDTGKTKENKRSFNTGAINSTGTTVLPLVFGEMLIGSIVASAEVVPHESSV